MIVSKEKATQNIMRLTAHMDSNNLVNSLNLLVKELDELEKNLPEIRIDGEIALRRLVPIAFQSSGQSSVVARFLLNLDRGNEFPFDMTDLRGLDYDIHKDCITVLKMDYDPLKKLHQYFENGDNLWDLLVQKEAQR